MFLKRKSHAAAQLWLNKLGKKLVYSISGSDPQQPVLSHMDERVQRLRAFNRAMRTVEVGVGIAVHIRESASLKTKLKNILTFFYLQKIY